MHAQPPFLLRYSPRYFAREEVAPAWFVHDPDTNRLSLRPGVYPPWLRSNAPPGDHSVWLYCEDDPDPLPDPDPHIQILQTCSPPRCIFEDCRSRYFRAGQQRKAHIPFRDKASQQWIRPIRRLRKQATPTRPAPKAAATAPPARRPVADHTDEIAEGEPCVGEVESNDEAMEEDMPGDAEGEAEHYNHPRADAGDGNELEDYGAYAARGFVPKSFHDPPEERMRSLEDYKART